jgi:hypothetical protein
MGWMAKFRYVVVSFSCILRFIPTVWGVSNIIRQFETKQNVAVDI